MLAQPNLLEAKMNVTTHEGKAFGPEVDLPKDAPLYDRLAAFFGRRVG